MYRNLEEVIVNTGICKTQIMRNCYNGNIRFCNYGFGENNVLVEEEDVKELKIEGKL